MASILPPEAAVSIVVNGITIDPTEHYAKDARNTRNIIITVKDVLTNPQRLELEQLGVKFAEDLGNNNLLCRYDPADLSPLRDLKDYVQQVDVYRNIYKIPEDLRVVADELIDGSSARHVETFRVDVMVHEGVSDMDALAETIAKKTGVPLDEIRVGDERIRLEVAADKLESIASDDRVRVMEEVLTPVLHDDQARRIVIGESATATSFDAGPLRGHDQVISVIDSGFDLGSMEDCHAAFKEKVAGLIPVGRRDDLGITEAQKVDDPVGHGTHVCGTIVGHHIKTSQGFIGGIAPESKIVVSSLMNKYRDLIAVMSVQNLFLQPYQEHGARIHTNSWGEGLGPKVDKSRYTQRPYNKSSEQIDAFVRDNPDALVLFSTGNNNETMKTQVLPFGEEKPSIGCQAAAKNCLTVGASGSTRITESPRDGKVLRIDQDKMCADSSRGPSLEKRTKPDVVAPGFNIFSAHSRHSRANLVAPTTNSETDPAVLFKVRSGSSHATPLVAGFAALLRQRLISLECSKPPGALLKALIINGADKLPDVDVAAQGFGRVNLQSSMAMLTAAPLLAADIIPTTQLASEGQTLIGAPLQQEDEFSFILMPASSVSSSSSNEPRELKVTMVYNDRPHKEIQNNLNLAVIDVGNGGMIKHGGVSEDAIDVQNNVEQVVWSPAPSGPVVVRVRAQKIFRTDDPQDFVLAWSTGVPYKGQQTVE